MNEKRTRKIGKGRREDVWGEHAGSHRQQIVRLPESVHRPTGRGAVV